MNFPCLRSLPKWILMLALLCLGGSKSSAKEKIPEYEWCLVMTDNRDLLEDNVNHAALMRFQNAEVALEYSKIHGYGFVFYNVGNECRHSKKGLLAPHWCKMPAVAHTMLYGVKGKSCANVMYLDTDVTITNFDMSIDNYFSYLISRGDVDVASPEWQILFTSDAPHATDSLCTGIFWLRNTQDACGILRNWWDAPPWPYRAEQQVVARGMYDYNRAYGARLQVAGSSHAWRRANIPKFNSSKYSFEPWDTVIDPFLWHRCTHLTEPRAHSTCQEVLESEIKGIHKKRQKYNSSRDIPYLQTTANISQVFIESTSGVCGPALPRAGLNYDHLNPDKCCHGQRLNQIYTATNGSHVQKPRKCWVTSNIGAARWDFNTC